MFEWSNAAPAEMQVPNAARGAMRATMGVARATGLPPAAVLALGVPALAQRRRCTPSQLLARAGVTPQDAFAAGLHRAQPEFVTDDPRVSCACAQPRAQFGGMPELGALVLGDIFTDALASFESAAGGGTVKENAPPPEAPAMADGWPAAPNFRAGNWDFDKSQYTLAQGDTLSGLARLYLGSPARYMEIWSLQPFRYTKAFDPSMVSPTRPAIKEGDVLVMPFEARDNAKAMYLAGKQSAPATAGAPGTIPGKSSNGVSNTAPTKAGQFLADHKVALAIGGVALLGALAYAAS